jgi:hypothetical protein
VKFSVVIGFFHILSTGSPAKIGKSVIMAIVPTMEDNDVVSCWFRWTEQGHNHLVNERLFSIRSAVALPGQVVSKVTLAIATRTPDHVSSVLLVASDTAHIGNLIRAIFPRLPKLLFKVSLVEFRRLVHGNCLPLPPTFWYYRSQMVHESRTSFLFFI